MPANRLIPSLLFALLWLAACTPPRAFPPPNSTPGGNWSVQLTQTGGFAGVQLYIQVSSDGMLTAEDKRSGRRVSSPVSPERMAELSRLLGQVKAPTAKRPPSVCADCFVYDLEIASGSGLVRIQADDMDLSASGAQALIQLLGQMRDQALRSGT